MLASLLALQLLEGTALVRVQAPLEPIQPSAQQLQAWAAHPQWTFGPFDESRVGFSSVRMVLELTPHECDRWRGDRSNSRVVLALEGKNGIRYWTVSESTTRASLEDPCEVTTDHNWTVTNKARDNIVAELAPQDPAVPVIQLRYEAEWWQPRGTVRSSHQLVFDLRPKVPVLAARLAQVDRDGRCWSTGEDLAHVTCSWSAEHHDIVCDESLRDAHRFSLLSSGIRLSRRPGTNAPRDLAEFVSTLLRDRRARGKWAEPDDVGTVRFVAEIKSRRPGRRILLFGAARDLEKPFVLGVHENGRTRVIPVSLQSALLESDTSPRESSPIALTEYRLRGEPPDLRVIPLGQDAHGVRVFRVVADTAMGWRSLYHVAIEERSDAITAGAIEVASSETLISDPSNPWETPDVCDPTTGPLVTAAKVRLRPLRIDYDLEPAFEMLGEPERDSGQCAVASRAIWVSGKGFKVNLHWSECSTTRFRQVEVRPDGSLQVRVYKPH